MSFFRMVKRKGIDIPASGSSLCAAREHISGGFRADERRRCFSGRAPSSSPTQSPDRLSWRRALPLDYRDSIPWLIGALLSGWISILAWYPASPVEVPPPPQALARPASQQEVEALAQYALVLEGWIADARQRTGGPIPLSDVEDHLEQPISLFDNPLIDGVGGIQESCPVDALEQPGLDWIYCPEDGLFKPNIP